MNKSSFQFSNPVLDRIEFQVNDQFDKEKCDGISMDSNTKVSMLDGNEAVVSLTVNIGDSSETQPFNISVRMSAVFTWDASIDQDRAKHMLNINAPAVLLSYIRPMVASMTNSSKYPLLNIPFVDFTKNQ